MGLVGMAHGVLYSPRLEYCYGALLGFSSGALWLFGQRGGMTQDSMSYFPRFGFIWNNNLSDLYLDKPIDRI
jgi:hypothetical protein